MRSDIDSLLEALTNALQLCIKNELVGYHGPNYKWDDKTIIFNFTSYDSRDLGLQKFVQLVKGEWKKPKSKFHDLLINNFDQIDLGLLTSFLLLTRLKNDQIIALAEQDSRYRPYAQTLGLLKTEDRSPILSVVQARDLIFQAIAQKGISLAAIAKQTGLSQVSLSNFKAGGDIKLSNLLKIAQAIGLKISLG